MTGRRSILALAVVVAATTAGVAVPPVSPAAARPPSPRAACEGRPGPTIAANQRIRVYESSLLPPRSGYHACRYDRRGTIYLGDDISEGEDPPPLRIAGWFVATETVDCARDGTCLGEVGVTDVRRRQTRRFKLPAAPDTPALVQSAELLVTARGSAAWIRQVRSGAFGYEVWAWPRGQQAARIDVLPAADARSLAVADGVVYWTNAGQPRSAPLP